MCHLGGPVMFTRSLVRVRVRFRASVRVRVRVRVRAHRERVATTRGGPPCPTV